MLNCQKCLQIIDRVPLLRCGHFICAKCYCDCKSMKINNCGICDKKLIRGAKKNK